MQILPVAGFNIVLFTSKHTATNITSVHRSSADERLLSPTLVPPNRLGRTRVIALVSTISWSRGPRNSQQTIQGTAIRATAAVRAPLQKMNAKQDIKRFLHYNNVRERTRKFAGVVNKLQLDQIAKETPLGGGGGLCNSPRTPPKMSPRRSLWSVSTPARPPRGTLCTRWRSAGFPPWGDVAPGCCTSVSSAARRPRSPEFGRPRAAREEKIDSV